MIDALTTDKVLVEKEGILCKAEFKYGKEPWTITTVHTNETISIQCGTESERLNTWKVIPFTDKVVLYTRYICIKMVSSIPFLLLLSQNLTLFDSNTILTSCVTSWIMTVIFFLKLGFFAWFSRPIASFMGASVVGHGIMAENIAC